VSKLRVETIENLAGVVNNAVLTRKYTKFGTYTTGTTVMVLDNTKPLDNEGVEIGTITMTPKKVGSRVMVRGQCYCSYSVTTNLIAALYKNPAGLGAVEAFATSTMHVSTGNAGMTLSVADEIVTTSLAPITFSLRVGGNGAGTLMINGASSASRFDGTGSTFLEAIEYQES